jgi:hypothetical protein
MFFDDHPWPHFHVRYAEFEAVINIEGMQFHAGRLPNWAWRLVRQWASEHEMELRENWERAETGQRLKRVAPLT